ncbi:hypothetical protein [Candidatus Regiella endosymbiont of Tuberolachnus salignus]|uniref:hypothetical protein n=1 Tax=Candidatus Regiella endosymbiont of Tuberolachnus salignus TaxID=3077956 RepID=UPI0030CC81FA
MYIFLLRFIYVFGSGSALFSIWQASQSKNIIHNKNGDSENSLLLSMNKIIFKKNAPHQPNLLDELSTDITGTRTQRLSFIMSCSNVATLIGLLGTFAGLSVTIGSTERPHSGRYCYGKTPWETWIASTELVKEKQLDNLFKPSDSQIHLTNSMA